MVPHSELSTLVDIILYSITDNNNLVLLETLEKLKPLKLLVKASPRHSNYTLEEKIKIRDILFLIFCPLKKDQNFTLLLAVIVSKNINLKLFLIERYPFCLYGMNYYYLLKMI